MSWLFLDTHQSGRYRLGLIHPSGQTEIRLYTGRTRSLLQRLAQQRVKMGSSWTGIVVVSGPGTFSSIRIGVLYANLLATCLRLPLYALRAEETLDATALMTSVDYVAPIYDAEPNITMPQNHSTPSRQAVSPV